MWCAAKMPACCCCCFVAVFLPPDHLASSLAFLLALHETNSTDPISYKSSADVFFFKPVIYESMI
jgi:hypothetical protein